MKKLLQRSVSLILAVALCLGLSSVVAFAEDDLTYVALGDSMSQGYMFTDYNEDPAGGHFCGWKGTSEKSYIKKFAKDLEVDFGKTVELIDLTIQGLQPDEVYAFLKPETFDFDSMTKGAQKHLDWWVKDLASAEPQNPDVYLFETFGDMSEYYIESIRKADVITYDIGMNYFGTYLNDYRGEDEVFTKLLPDNLYTRQIETVRSAVSNILGSNGMEAIGSKLDGILYAYMSYMVYTDKCITAIKELNPDVEIILVPLANPHKDLYVDIEGIKISFSTIIDLMLESLNGYMKYTSPNRNLYTIAPLSGPVTSFADELYKYPDDLSEDIEKLLEQAMFGSNSVLGTDLYPIPSAFSEVFIPTLASGYLDSVLYLEYMFSMVRDPSEEVHTDEGGNYLMYWNVFDRLVYDYIAEKYGTDVAYNDFFGDNYIDVVLNAAWPNPNSVLGANFYNYGYVDSTIHLEILDSARAAIEAGTAETWQKHLIEAVDVYYGDNWLDICKKAATYRTIPLDAFTGAMNDELSGLDAEKVIRILQDPDSVTDDDYIAIHLAIRYGRASRGFGAHPCPRGLEVKHDAVRKAYQSIVNHTTHLVKKPVALSAGEYSLYLNNKDKGIFTFEQVDSGWSIYNGSKFLAMKDGKLVLSSEPFAWTYKNGAFSTSVKTTQKDNGYWLGFIYVAGRGTKTVTTTYYLSTVMDGAKLSTANVSAALYEEISGAHEYGDAIYVDRTTHKHVCKDCGDAKFELHDYDEATGYCACGAFDPEKADVKISVVDVKTKTTKQLSGWGWYSSWKNVTTYTATIKTEATGVKVTTVQYQVNGGKWMTGTAVSSDKPIETLKIKAWDTNGNLYKYEYPEAPAATFTVTFEPEKDGNVEIGEVHNAGGQKVTEITVPSGAGISVDSNTITIGENTFTAEANSGWTFSGFNPSSGTITADTTIKVCFAQNQPD